MPRDVIYNNRADEAYRYAIITILTIIIFAVNTVTYFENRENEMANEKITIHPLLHHISKATVL